MSFTVTEETHQYVVFVESRVSGERHYSPLVDLDEALAIMQWNARISTVRQWIEQVPELEDWDIDMLS
jgi:hypothetical protein